jgi:hypothetical protein
VSITTLIVAAFVVEFHASAVPFTAVRCTPRAFAVLSIRVDVIKNHQTSPKSAHAGVMGGSSVISKYGCGPSSDHGATAEGSVAPMLGSRIRVIVESARAP